MLITWMSLMMMTQIASDGEDSKLEHEIAFYNHLLSVVAKRQSAAFDGLLTFLTSAYTVFKILLHNSLSLDVSKTNYLKGMCKVT